MCLELSALDLLKFAVIIPLRTFLNSSGMAFIVKSSDHLKPLLCHVMLRLGDE